jgi:hypothetical protein
LREANERAKAIDGKIASLMAEGCSKPVIAQRLGISKALVEVRIKSIAKEKGRQERKARGKAGATEAERLEKGSPRKCRAVISLTGVRRKLFCARYDACLDHAVAKQWPNFHCDSCRDYIDATPKAADECEGDLERCGVLAGKCLS